MTKAKKLVDVYVRVSRVGAREHLTSPDEQEQQARNFAKTHNLRIGEVFVDLDESGGKLDRPGLQQALERVEKGESGGIVVAYLSRLSRETSQGLAFIEKIRAAGGDVYAPNLSDHTTADGRMLNTITLAIDTGYRERKREEFERAKENAVARGIPVHTRPAVGYKPRRDRRLEPDPRTAPTVREVFERRARGEGPAALARFLESRGVKTSQGSRTWSKPAVYGLLQNVVYLGQLRYGRDDRYVNSAAHEPLVDRALWEAAQHPNGRRLTPTRSATPGLLSGLLRCAACRYAMQYTTTSRGKRIYRCTRRHAAGICPTPASVAAATIETAAVDAFWKLTRDLEAVGVVEPDDNLEQAEEALERAERLLQQLEGADAQEALGEDYLSVYRERRRERDRAAEELGRTRSATTSVKGLPTAETLSGAWDRMTVPERRELLGLRFDVLAFGRENGLVVYAAGHGPADLPRRGFKQAPVLEPFPALSGVRE